MATTGRIAPSTLIDALEQESRSFSFFEAVELIEAQRADCVRVGYSGPVEREAVRFVGNVSLGFPSSDIDSIARETDAQGLPRYRMAVNFLGLYGAGSPLPTWYTEDLVHGEIDEHAVKDFLDLFQHRLVSLLRRCGTKYRYYRAYRPDGSDPISQWLFALLGVLHPSLRQGTSLDWQRLLAYAGVLAMRRHSAPMLRGVLAHYFAGAPIAIEQYVPELAAIEPEQWAMLGSANCRLGQDLTLGAFVPDCAGRIRVRVGPLDFARFERFLPEGPDWTALADLVALLLTDELRCDVELALSAEEIPALRLEEGCPCRLGLSTWLGECESDGRVLFPG